MSAITVVFDSSGGFNLPKGGDASRAGLPLQARSPDTSWVRLDRRQALTSEQRRRFLALCPDFVIKLRSETDSIEKLQDMSADADQRE